MMLLRTELNGHYSFAA